MRCHSDRRANRIPCHPNGAALFLPVPTSTQFLIHVLRCFYCATGPEAELAGLWQIRSEMQCRTCAQRHVPHLLAA